MSERNAIEEYVCHRVPDLAVRQAVFGLLADIIEQVNSRNGSVWSLTFPSGTQLRLNIGNLEAFNTSRNRADAWFMILARRPDAVSYAERHALSGDQYLLEEFAAGFAADDGVERFFLRGEEFADHRDELLEIFREAALILSMKYKRTNKAASHSREAVEMIGELVGRELPQPAFSKPSAGIRTDDRDSQGQEPGRGVGGSLENVANAFAEAGLTYTDSQIASFYTALQTKGFVILSGISGTGKSKIAQRFSGLLVLDRKEAPIDIAENAREVHRLRLMPYMRAHKRFYVPAEIGRHLRLPGPGESFDVMVQIGATEEGARARVRNGTPNALQVFMRRRAAEAFREFDGPYFYLEIEEDERTGLPARFSVSASPTASQVVSDLGLAKRMEATHLFLPVRPDWRDGKALIGYHNPLTGEYVRTDFLEFVIAAGDDYRAGNRNAFFVILDEMNLAHVEYYFADVLSVIESGRYPDGHKLAGWTVEGIPLAVREEDVDLPERLRLPPNLYIVGTVNMDETTHPFSPKVLDRAFTIELTDVDFSGYPPDPVDGDVALDDDERQALLRAFTQDGRYPRIDKDDIREVVERHGRFRDDLHHLNTSLKRYRMHFGYRVFDEIIQFVHNAERNELFSADEAFDHAVLMKVLPKFNGSRARLERPLIELILWSRQHVPATEDEAREVVTELENLLLAGKGFDALVRDSDDWRYPATGKRAALMMQDLYTDGFASFG